MNNFNLTPTIISGGTFNVGISNDQKQLVGQMGVVNATSNNYNDLSNKPSINDVILVGNKTGAELGIVNVPVNPEHPANAPSPITLRLLGRFNVPEMSSGLL